jgi:microcystin-dependent protein
MPSANGVYTLPVGYLAVTGATIQASQHNPPLEDIAAALTARLSRDGTAPMTGPIQAAAGSAAAPSVTFAADNSKGLFSSTNGVGVSVGATQVAEFTAAGLASGVWSQGMMLPWWGSAVPSALWVFPYGQTLNRMTYAKLWAFAQAEILAGNAFFNNGDGSTTFGIGDMRGRVFAGLDNMGSSAAGRLTSAVMTPDGNTIGATGGVQNRTLVTANLPPYTPSGSVSTTLNMDGGGFLVTGGGFVNIGGSGSGGFIFSGSASSSFTGSAQGGTSTPFPTISPTMLGNFILFVGGAT